MEEFLVLWALGFFACNILGFLFVYLSCRYNTVRHGMYVFCFALLPGVNLVVALYALAFSLTILASIFLDAFERKYEKTLDQPLSTLFKRNSK